MKKRKNTKIIIRNNIELEESIVSPVNSNGPFIVNKICNRYQCSRPCES
jgi:hypothetical protein